MADATINDLIGRAQRGSPEAYGDLYNCLYQEIYRYLCYRTGDPMVAEDLTSEVFLRMVQALPRYRVEASPFKAWLFQIARNLAIDHYRQAGKQSLVVMDENMGSADPEMDRMIESRLNSASLLQSLASMDELYRDVLLLRFIEDLSAAETARILEKSEDAVKALQRRALLALRVMLKHQEIDLA